MCVTTGPEAGGLDPLRVTVGYCSSWPVEARSAISIGDAVSKMRTPEPARAAFPPPANSVLLGSTNFISGTPGFATSGWCPGDSRYRTSPRRLTPDRAFSVRLRGYMDQFDNAMLKTALLDVSMLAISTRKVGGIDATGRNNPTVLVYDGKTGLIPLGTRSILFTLQMSRLQFIKTPMITGTPTIWLLRRLGALEPGISTMFALGCGLVASSGRVCW